MPPPSGAAAHRHRIVRRVCAVRGRMRFLVDVARRFDYARARHEVRHTPYGALSGVRGWSSPCPHVAHWRSSPAAPRAPASSWASATRRPSCSTASARRAAGALLRCRRDRRVRRHRGVLAGLAAPVALQRPLARDGAPLRADAAHPTRPPARSWPPPPPACRRPSVGHATGTIATPGCAMPPSRSTRCSGSASPRRPARSWPGCRSASGTGPTVSPDRCRSCTASTAARTFPRRCSRIWRATGARRRCGSATARRPSCSSTCTAS